MVYTQITMVTLTTIAVTSRKTIRYSIYFVLFLIVARITWGIGSGVFRSLFPKPPPPPTTAFGSLPALPFPVKDLPALQYKIETAEGGLPTLPTQAKIYFMPKSSASLLSLDAAKQKAASLGFRSQPTEITQTLYKFAHPRAEAILEINIVTDAFSISYDLAADPSPLDLPPPAAEIAVSQVRSFLSPAGLLPEDLTGPPLSEFLKIEKGSLVAAISLSEADLIKVKLFRKAYDELPSLTPSPNEANVWFIVSGSRSRDRQIIAGEYHYYPVDEAQFSTYPIKLAQTAFDELVAGSGYIANLGQNTDGTITIRRVYLGYYDSEVRADFFQPVVVFEGDNGFVAYVPAVTQDLYGN